MGQIDQNIIKEFKNTVNILTKYTDKFANVRVAKEIKISRRKRNAEIITVVNQMIKEIDKLVQEESQELFTCRRIIQNVKILDIALKTRLNNFEDFKCRLTNKEMKTMNEFAFSECQKIGNKYCMISGDSCYMKYGENCINVIMNRYITKCTYEINKVELEIDKQIYLTFRTLDTIYRKFNSYIPAEENRKNIKDLARIKSNMAKSLDELKVLNKGISDTGMCVVSLSEEDTCFLGANDYVIHIEKANQLKAGLEYELERNLKVVSNLIKK